MQRFLASSLLVLAVCFSILVIPHANALPVSYNQTALNFGLTSVPRNSSSFDVFTLNQDNWLWEKFDNTTIDSSPLSIPATITYNTNLKALYKFENVITATVGNTGTVTGSTAFTSGQEGRAFQFDGSSYISGSDTGYPSGSKPSFTFTGWIYPTTVSGFHFIYQWGTAGGNDIQIEQNGNKISVSNDAGIFVTSATTFSANTWTYVTVTFDGTTMKMFFNGVQDANTATPTFTVTLNTFYNGAKGDTSAKFNGNMDELRLYNTALSLAQINGDYMVGHYSQSHTFDGGEYVSLGNVFPFERTNPFTLSFWMKSSISTSTLIPIINNGINFDQQGIKTYIQFGAVNVRLTNTASTNEISVSASGLTTNDGNWHYYSIVYNGNSLASGISIYQDGISKTVTVNTNNLISTIVTANSWTVGAFSGGITPMTGQIDNLKVYPYALSASQITSDYNSISPISSGKQFMSYYNGKQGSATLTEKIGSTKSSLTLSCTPDSTLKNMGTNNTKIYYTCPPSGNNAQVAHIDISSGTTTNDFVASNNPGSVNNMYVFPTITKMFFVVNNGAATGHIVSKANGNVSANSMGTSVSISNQKVFQSTTGFKYNYNGSSTQTVTAVKCELYYSPTAKNQTLDDINCDISMPASMTRYWNGMLIQNIGSFSTNSTQQFLNSIDASSYKKLLSLPCIVLVNENPCVTFIATDLTQTDYLVVLTSTHVYYGNAQTALHLLQNNNYALQSYDIITPLTTSAYEIQNPILQGITLYGFNLNTTTNKAGLFTLPSGYTTKTTTINSAIRTIDPRWTNDATDIPIITTTQSLFPIFLTASNAPSFAAIKVTQPTQIINGQEAVYAVAQLDSTRSVEFDLVAGTCANIYIADISVSPTVWDFEGIICATGVNQKTIAFTNTVPFTFYTLKYGVTDSFVPSNNGLTTTFHTNAAPTTYTVIIRNSTGTVAVNQTFTVPANTTQQTQSFNLTGVTKPAALSVTVAGNQIYSAYLGSPLSLSNMASFFHQYFNYQGFDLLSFIPVVFASMFTRNTVGVGMALTVVCIATLSWLSIVVVPEPIVYVSIFVACIGIVGYRSIYG